MKRFKFSILLLALTVLISCSKDDNSDDMDDEDIQQLVENFVTPDLLQSLRDLGFNFNDGQDSPDISGAFLFSNTILGASNIQGDAAVGTQFNDATFMFSNLNPEQRTFTFSVIENGTTQGQTQATFYSGVGNRFTAYVRTSVAVAGAEPILLYAITGTISEEGITSAQFALLMLDDKGDPNGTLIANGEGRLFNDQDGTANRQ
ncbi:hypothetical protein ACFQO1_01095 [Jejudonia soesokkakensis]|uniref:Uncharacterized protein n=1 Tax=Jejudonia soesokkakensis TaxID=1323432 RepID=A0ABW2MRX5_9FLAO